MESAQTRSAVVTGASGGIGREVAVRLALDGFAVVVNYAGNADKAAQTVEAVEAAGGRALAVRADVAVEADVDRLFAATAEAYGTVAVVVHAAGIMPLQRIVEGDLEAFDRVVATNLRGTFLVLGRSARQVSDGGRIVVLSTSVIGLALPTYGPYVASKAGAEALVRVLANEMRGRGLTVNAVAPGPVATELFLAGKPEALVEQMSKMPPLERLGQPGDVAGVVSFLAGPDGGWVNGQVVRANGGLV